MTDEEFAQPELFDVFSNGRRRRTVQYLRRKGGECDLGPLVEQIAAWENDTAPEQVTRAQRRRVYISLYQTHLPMLADHGIVEWDADSHTIVLLPDEDVFEPYLDRTVGGRRNWDLLYAAVTAAGFVALVVALLPIGPFPAAAALPIALVLSCVVLLVALVHRASRRGAPSPTFDSFLS